MKNYNKKKMDRKVENKTKKFILNFSIALLGLLTMPIVCYAVEGDQFFNNFVSLFFGFVQKAALLVMAFGGIKLGLGIHSQTEEEKIQGLKTLIAGGVVFAIATTPSMFGLLG